MVSEHIFGKMVANAMESGSTTTCLDTVSSFMQTVFALRVNSFLIRRRASVFTNGQTEETMKVGGTRANSTDSASTLIQ